MRVFRFWLLALVLCVSLAGCGSQFAKTVGTLGGILGSPNPIANGAAEACTGKYQAQAVAEQVGSFCGADNSGIEAALNAASGLLTVIWPSVKDGLDQIRPCAADPNGVACKASWLSGFPAALCTAVKGCAGA